MTRIKTAVK